MCRSGGITPQVSTHFSFFSGKLCLIACIILSNDKYSVHNIISSKIFLHLFCLYFIFYFCFTMQCLLEITCFIAR